MDQSSVDGSLRRIERQYEVVVQDTNNLIQTEYSLSLVETYTVIDPFFFTRITDLQKGIRIQNIKTNIIEPKTHIVLIVRL